AHWEQHLPLREELEIICSKFPSAIILIDDFRVDDDSTYHFDDYGNGNTVATSYLETANTPALYQFFPTTCGSEETGMRRGCTVLTAATDIADQIRSISLLRQVSV